MAKRVKSYWQTEIYEGLPKRDLASCEYYAYVPDRLDERLLRFEPEVVQAITQAESP